MKLIGWIFGGGVALALILLAVSNRAPVTLRFEPLPFLLDAPLYAPLLAMLVIGFVLGGIIAWLGGHRWRSRARRAEAEVQRLRHAQAEAVARAPIQIARAPATPLLPKAG